MINKVLKSEASGKLLKEYLPWGWLKLTLQRKMINKVLKSEASGTVSALPE